MAIHFVKMQGIGNDYVYLDAVSEPALAERDDLPILAREMSDRHTGIGADGLILVCRPSSEVVDADVRMRMFNADGSESEMCGNGLRCVAKFAHDRLGIKTKPMRVETEAGVLSIEYEVNDGRLTMATVDMGEPIVYLVDVPVAEDELAWYREETRCGGIKSGEQCWIASFVSMGNPHAVLFECENKDLFSSGLAALDVAGIGSSIEHNRAFANRINAHFVDVHSLEEATMRTWERGSGITRACGTGACAVCVAGVRTGCLDREVLLHLPGGDLTIRWDERTNHVFMTGPASESFTGIWPDDRSAAGEICAPD